MQRSRHRKMGLSLRRGEALVEVVASVTIFAIAMVAFGTQWVHARQQLTLVRENQVLARIHERQMENVRSIGPYYMPNMTSPEVHYYDASGQKVASSTPTGYYSQTTITYQQNPNNFKDGTGGMIGTSSLREVKVVVYRTGSTEALVDVTTYVAPTGTPGAI